MKKFETMGVMLDMSRIAELEEEILPSPKSVEGESAYNNFYRNIATSNAL
jgi:hypothetical protein